MSFVLRLKGTSCPLRTALSTTPPRKPRLRRAGRPVDDFDLMIGCTALRHSLTLVTRNTRHFADLANLPLENWIDAS